MILLYPWVLLGFPLFLLCETYCSARSPKIYFPNFTMLLKATNRGKEITRLLRYVIVGLIFLALSTPVEEHRLTQDHGIGYDISLLLDASNSMEEDQRFEAAKAIISRFVKSRQGDRLALSVFADYAYLSVPLTSHKDALNTVLRHLQTGVAGNRHTALYEALYLGARVFEKHSSRQKIVILLTDGLNTVKSISLHIALNEAKKQHLKVYTIGIGDDYRKGILQRIAKETGGKFYEAGDPQALQSIYQEINQLEKSQFSTETITLHTPYFRYPLLLALLLMLPYLLLLHRQRSLGSREYAMVLLTLVALYGPYSAGERLQIHPPSKSMMLALDLSYSMDCKDSYPSRLQIAYNRASTLIDMASGTRIGVAGFATQSYLIAPPTQDHANLKQLLKQMDISHLHREGSHILSAIQAADILLPKQEKRVLVLFTDGGERQDFDPEIIYAKAHHIQVSIYTIGTRKGGVIKEKKQLRKDHAGNIIITRVNPAIKTLAMETGGSYVRHSTSEHTLRNLLDTLQTEQSKVENKNDIYYQTRELFYLPLFLALLLLLRIHFGLRKKR